MGGCAGRPKKTKNVSKVATNTGTLAITITTAHITHQASIFKMDPYIMLKVSNQQHKTNVKLKADKQPEFNQTFNFEINSCYKIHGRDLQMRVMDKKKVGSDNQVGFGIVDIDPVIKFKKTREEMRCFINYGTKTAGFINFIAQFKEEQARTLSFKFLMANLQRNTSTIGNANCYVKVTIGEQILSTNKQQDTKEVIPSWTDDVLIFNVGTATQFCQIILYDEKTQVGRTKILMSKLLASHQEQNFAEQLLYKEKPAAVLKFTTLLGENPHFKDVPVEVRKTKLLATATLSMVKIADPVLQFKQNQNKNAEKQKKNNQEEMKQGKQKKEQQNQKNEIKEEEKKQEKKTEKGEEIKKEEDKPIEEKKETNAEQNRQKVQPQKKEINEQNVA